VEGLSQKQIENPKRPLWVSIAAWYSIVLAAITFLGVLVTAVTRMPPGALGLYAVQYTMYDPYGDPIMSSTQSSLSLIWELTLIALAGLIAALTAWTGFWLLKQRNLGRVLFFVCSPCALIALGISWAKFVWMYEIPQTVLLIPVYILLALFLTRSNSLQAAGITVYEFGPRGGWIVLACLVAALLFWIIAYSLSRSSGLQGLSSLYGAIGGSLALQYFGALVCTAIPNRKPKAISAA